MSKPAVHDAVRPLPTIEELPPRVQQMVRLVILHREAICRYNIGQVELHFHEQSVKAKLVQNLSI